MIEEAILEGRWLAHENRLEGKDLDELDELEDDEDEDFLEGYRYETLINHCNIFYLMLSLISYKKTETSSRTLSSNFQSSPWIRLSNLETRLCCSSYSSIKNVLCSCTSFIY